MKIEISPDNEVTILCGELPDRIAISQDIINVVKNILINYVSNYADFKIETLNKPSLDVVSIETSLGVIEIYNPKYDDLSPKSINIIGEYLTNNGYEKLKFRYLADMYKEPFVYITFENSSGYCVWVENGDYCWANPLVALLATMLNAVIGKKKTPELITRIDRIIQNYGK